MSQVIGRLGQSIMAYYSWKAFSAYVRVSMDSIPVTFDTFFAIYLEEAASLKSTAKLIRDFATRQGLRSRLAMAYIVTTMLFLLAWPTLASAMTGYTAAEGAYVFDNDGNLLSIAGFHQVLYVIHDGWRIGLKGNHLVAYGSMTCEYKTSYPFSGCAVVPGYFLQWPCLTCLG
jgi:hypothetical protein